MCQIHSCFQLTSQANMWDNPFSMSRSITVNILDPYIPLPNDDLSTQNEQAKRGITKCLLIGQLKIIVIFEILPHSYVGGSEVTVHLFGELSSVQVHQKSELLNWTEDPLHQICPNYGPNIHKHTMLFFGLLILYTWIVIQLRCDVEKMFMHKK